MPKSKKDDSGWLDENSDESEEVRSSSGSIAPPSGDVGEESKSCCARSIPHKDAVHLNTFLQRESKRVARNPCTYLCSAMFLTIALGAVGLIVGEFAIEVENEGWWSRGTVQSDRQRQANLIRNQRFNLAFNESAWDIWTDPDSELPSYETLLYSAPEIPDAMLDPTQTTEDGESAEDDGGNIINRALSSMHKMLQAKVEEDKERRRLDEGMTSVLEGCDLEFYSWLSPGNLWPLWKIPDKEYESTDTRSVLDSDVLEAICVAESNTQSYLEENGLCDTQSNGCNSGKCLPPYSIVLWTRLIVNGGLDATADGEYVMDCKALSEAWTPDLQEYARRSWIEDVTDLKILLTPGAGSGGEKDEPKYPHGYYPALLQSDFDTNGGRSQVTSSVFDTASVTNGTVLYDVVENFDRAKDSEIVLGAYDTGWEEMAEIKADSLVAADMTLALASAVVISVAIMVHTQSPLLTGLGLLQIVLSFPMSYFVYALVLRFDYFPFLNFMGVFIVFALGAGDIYVAFDKWTNYRKNNKTKSTEYVAAYALPESTSAMFLTTITTALAFFATAVCPVAPIKMFAIFCGLLILLDYLLVILFIFPGLCIYDQALIKRAARTESSCLSGCWSGCVGCGTCMKCCSHTVVYDDVIISSPTSEHFKGSSAGSSPTADESESSDEIENYNATQRLMLSLSNVLYKLRWPLLAVSIITFGLFCYFATKLGLPESSDVRLLKPSIQYEQAYEWRKELLASDLDDLSGSSNAIYWGLDAADTGFATDPYDGTALVLDETFNPTSTESQIHLRDFCDNLFGEEFARLPNEFFVCPMNQFDQWLKDEFSSDEPDPVYNSECGSPDGIPVASDKFHACMSAWAMKARNFDVLSKDGKVKYMRVPFRNEAIFTDPYEVLQEQWEAIDEWMTASNEDAPKGVNQAFFTSITFHWHDTNGSIQKSAYSGAGISLAASAGVILLSSKSVVLTLFSTATILYILASVTSFLTAFGWTLGFLESICFSILIGVSVDFVIHFTHAYVHHKGDMSRQERTKYSMVTMGPSILATAATTFFSAIVMLFCTITFFRKFALVLFLAVIMATIGSFVFFITLTNCFGPTNPTYLVDKCLSPCFGKKEGRDAAITSTRDESE